MSSMLTKNVSAVFYKEINMSDIIPENETKRKSTDGTPYTREPRVSKSDFVGLKSQS